jgi:hypothetical protein
VSLSPPPPEVRTVFKALETGCVDPMYEDQIQTFVLEALECTAAFKAVQATASLLNQYMSESMQTEVDYCTREAELNGYYRIALPKVLQFLKSHEFAAMNVPNALDWIQKWDAWSELLDYVRWHANAHEDGRFMVRALSERDEAAVWHVYWHWVYLAADKRGEDDADDFEYDAVTHYLQHTIQDTGGSKPTAWERGFRFWYIKGSEKGIHAVTRRRQFMQIDIAGHMLMVANKWFGLHPSTSYRGPWTRAASHAYLTNP